MEKQGESLINKQLKTLYPGEKQRVFKLSFYIFLNCVKTYISCFPLRASLSSALYCFKTIILKFGILQSD